MPRARAIVTLLGCVLLAGCSLSHPHYVAPDVHVGQPAFERTLEAHTLSSRVDGNSAQLHNPAYDFNDEAIPAGTSYWVRLAETALAG